MSIDQSPVVTPIEEVLRDSVMAYIQQLAIRPTLHYLSLDLIKNNLESGNIDPATALAHLDRMNS